MSQGTFQRQIENVEQLDLEFNDEQRKQSLSEVERENMHVTSNYGEDIDEYQRELEQ